MPYARILLDEHVDTQLAATLQRESFDVAAVEDLGLKGAPDPDILTAAIRDERALLTYNLKHFVPLAREYALAGKPHF